MPGDGPSVGAPLTADPRIAGVSFTGSTEVARTIERQLAETAAPDAMLIAETGGLNAMIVDSTALPEQAVRDILASAFQSAGQRCSALRMLYVQKDVEARMLDMLKGAMAALEIGDPWAVLDRCRTGDRRGGARRHCRLLRRDGRQGAAGRAYRGAAERPVRGPACVPGEGQSRIWSARCSGPLLHVATYEAEDLDRIVRAVNGRGYGLTFGLHTRIEERVAAASSTGSMRATSTSTATRSAPWSGRSPLEAKGLSGTGPKAGGPHYLRALPARSSYGRGSGWRRAGRAANAFRTHAGCQPRQLGRAGRPGGNPAQAFARQGSRGDRRGRRARFRAGGSAGGRRARPTRSLCSRAGGFSASGRMPATLMWQVVQALGAGNAVLGGGRQMQRPPSSRCWARACRWPLLDGRVDPGALEPLAVDLVAYSGEGEAQRALRKALATRQGAIVPLVSEVVYPAAYTHERAVCVDTTAAGGKCQSSRRELRGLTPLRRRLKPSKTGCPR